MIFLIFNYSFMLRTSRLFYTFPKRTFYTPANFIFRSYSKKKMSEEQIDVCNEDGSSAGYAVSRSQIHAKGLWHRSCIFYYFIFLIIWCRVVHTWIVNSKGELVLQLRSPNKEVWIQMHPLSNYSTSLILINGTFQVLATFPLEMKATFQLCEN